MIVWKKCQAIDIIIIFGGEDNNNCLILHWNEYTTVICIPVDIYDLSFSAIDKQQHSI